MESSKKTPRASTVIPVTVQQTIGEVVLGRGGDTPAEVAAFTIMGEHFNSLLPSDRQRMGMTYQFSGLIVNAREEA